MGNVEAFADQFAGLRALCDVALDGRLPRVVASCVMTAEVPNELRVTEDTLTQDPNTVSIALELSQGPRGPIVGERERLGETLQNATDVASDEIRAIVGRPEGHRYVVCLKRTESIALVTPPLLGGTVDILTVHDEIDEGEIGRELIAMVSVGQEKPTVQEALTFKTIGDRVIGGKIIEADNDSDLFSLHQDAIDVFGTQSAATTLLNDAGAPWFDPDSLEQRLADIKAEALRIGMSSEEEIVRVLGRIEREMLHPRVREIAFSHEKIADAARFVLLMLSR